MADLKQRNGAIWAPMLVAILAFGLSGPAAAQDNSHKPLGVGVEVMSDLAANVKYFFTRNIAVEGAFGGRAFSFRGVGGGMFLHMDANLHYQLAGLIDVKKGELDPYVGGGLGFNHRGGTRRVGVGLGGFGAVRTASFNWGEVRFPVGLEYYYDFDSIAASFFWEIAPMVGFGNGGAFGDGSTSLGARVHF